MKAGYPRETEDQRSTPVGANRSRIVIGVVAILLFAASALYCGLSLWGSASSVAPESASPPPAKIVE